jgi:hypothetical protein
MTLLIDEYECYVVERLTSFNFKQHYSLILQGKYEREAIREMLIELLHFLRIKRDTEYLPEVAQMLTFYSDEDEHAKITTDHLLYIVARAEWVFKRKPRSPNAMYI